MNMTKAYLPLMALVMLAALAPGCMRWRGRGAVPRRGRGDSTRRVGRDAGASPEPGITAADVEEAIRAAIADMPQPESGLTSADVEEAIRAAMAEIPQSVEGLTKAEVEQIVQTAIASIPEPRAGLTSAEAEQIARGVVASIPPKSAPPEYTRFFVENAISRYETHGLDATLAYYNREGNIDGQWYVFIIIDENDLVIGHPDAHRLGLDLKGSVGTDANGYNFGQDMLAAGEEGRWVS